MTYSLTANQTALCISLLAIGAVAGQALSADVAEPAYGVKYQALIDEATFKLHLRTYLFDRTNISGSDREWRLRYGGYPNSPVSIGTSACAYVGYGGYPPGITAAIGNTRAETAMAETESGPNLT